MYRSGRGDRGDDVTPGTVRFQNGVEVRVEIVSEPDEMARGLMGQTSLAEECGMLFWMSRRDEHFFYMRQTRIPLDLIFCDREQVVGVLTLVPMDETRHSIGRPSTSILEVNGGWAERHGITIGQKVTISLT